MKEFHVEEMSLPELELIVKTVKIIESLKKKDI